MCEVDGNSLTNNDAGSLYIPCAFFLTTQVHPEVRRLWAKYALPRVSKKISGTFRFQKNALDQASYYTRDWLVGVLPATIYDQIIGDSNGGIGISDCLEDYARGLTISEHVIEEFSKKGFDEELYGTSLALVCDFGSGNVEETAAKLNNLVNEVEKVIKLW